MIRKVQRAYTLEDGITQGLLGGFCNCRQWAEHYLNFWERVGTKEGLYFGSLFHFLLEKTYIRKTSLISSKRSPMFFDECLKLWKKEEGLTAGPQKSEEIVVKVRAVYLEYLRYWSADVDKKWLAVEGKFDLMWNGYRLRGMRDGVYEDLKALAWLLETKTTAQLSEDALTDALTFDFQNLFYIVTWEDQYQRKMAGVLYNVVKNPALRPKQIKVQSGKGKSITRLETFSELAQRIEEDVRTRPEEYFHRYQLSYPESVKARFREELKIKLDEFRAWREGHMSTYRNQGHCRTRWSCEFLQGCSANGNMAGYLKTRQIFRELGGR